MLDEAWGQMFGVEVKSFVAQQIGPIINRIDALEKRQPERGEKGDPGLNGKDGANGIDGKEGPPGLNGKDGANGIDGKGGVNGKDGPPGKDGKDGVNGERGEDGLSVDIVEIEKFITNAVAEIPRPKDGAPGPKGEPGPKGDQGEAGQSIKGDQGIPGRDGQPGRDGIGRDGKDGKDGMSYTDVNEFYEDDGRVLVRQLQSLSGEVVKTFRHITATPIFRGVWKQREYLKGDMVTYNGSQWIALNDTSSKPNEPNSDWQLTAKRGRDGKV